MKEREFEIRMRAQYMAELLKSKGVILFNDFPKKSEFWKKARKYIEVLAIFPRSEWKRLKELLREEGWSFSGDERVVVYLGKGYRMKRTICLTYCLPTGSDIYPLAYIKFIWYSDDILMGIHGGRFSNGFFDTYPYELEQYGVNKVFAEAFLQRVKEEKIPAIMLEKFYKEGEEEE